MDVQQIQPIDGLPTILSQLIMSNFTFQELHHSMRSSNDIMHQQILQLT